jgi:hypothetical protein
MYKSRSPIKGMLLYGIWWLKYAIKRDILGINRVKTNSQVSIMIKNIKISISK